jgi:hypothetical protein
MSRQILLFLVGSAFALAQQQGGPFRQAAEPAPADQSAMQDALRRYLLALNVCDGTAVRASLTDDFAAAFSWGSRAASARLLPNPANCPPGKPPFEITALARVFRVVANDVVQSDAFYRTIGKPKGDEAGRVSIVFVRRAMEWRIFSLRFMPLQFEPPYFAVEAAKLHDGSDPDGWITLFDGTSTSKWIDVEGGDALPKSWRVEGRALHTVADENGRSLRTRDTYRSFEMRFEWKATPKGNSGVKYHLYYMNASAGGSDGAGFEYQVADDSGDPGAVAHPVERSGSLYNQIAAKGAVLKPVGEYNESAIVVRGRHCEHWLNGVKVVEFEAESNPPESPVLLQHHETEMWFRNIRIRRLD